MRYFMRMVRSSEKSYKLHITLLGILSIFVIVNLCLLCYGDKQKYLTFPMTTIVYKGGLGNQLFEVLSLLGIARKLKRIAVFNSSDPVLQSNLEFLNQKLPRISEQVISVPIEPSETTRFAISSDCCRYELSDNHLADESKFLVIEGHYFQSYKYFADMKLSIKEWLKPEDPEKFRMMISKTESQRHKTCVHVRRGDFLTDEQHAGTDSNYTISAIDHLRSLYHGVIFIMSNDPKWVKVHIADHLDYQKDIRIMKTLMEDAIDDLHFSQIYCDSVLITAPSSTFGWWIGYLSKNQSAVYYRDIRETKDQVQLQMTKEDFYPPTWNKLVIP
ncbi:L-Fucosyltransferase [Caenorhabditis elegans]|uniref:L-Fucosyltransferase n=1 Tax=Caenorhabditis elegans TaxID=6239 RepID=O45510_CAEEL|nr:L-Fucosyltransferase [Caenorhabditis elegans]CAB04377.2 L-Fucosyltransferase [Caenorhabditis elegans]|eukprot:NP_493095.2 Uncharacterized protein CELE_F41D3.6 [Caenorhabditis elegans]